MSDFASAEIEALARAQSLATSSGLANVDGFIEWKPAAPAPAPAALRMVDETDNRAWFEFVNDKPAEVHALGCHQLFDVRLQRHGALFHGNSYVVDPSHIGDVAAAEIQALGGEIKDTDVIQSERPGVIFVGPGIRIYGHWLVDFIPRLRIAQQVLGPDFEDYVVPLPIGTPPWALAMMRTLCGVVESQVLWFDPDSQSVDFHHVLAPTYCHASYHMHPEAAGFWPIAKPHGAQRRLCISRLHYETRTDGVLKSFANRSQFEAMAVEMGYELIYPETLALVEQMKLFASASHVVGEYGSALHSMLFAPPGAIVGAIRCPNDVQLRISALREQTTVLLIPEKEWINEQGGQAYLAREESLRSLLELME